MSLTNCLFLRDVLPQIGRATLKSLTEKGIRAVLDRVVEPGSNRMAVMLLSDLKQMFRWAEKRKPWRKLIEDNPVEHPEAKKITSDDYEGTARARTLSADEIKELADKLPTAGLLKRAEIAMWIMLSCCCRIGEIVKAKWERYERMAYGGLEGDCNRIATHGLPRSFEQVGPA